jgi:hypothetical protein
MKADFSTLRAPPPSIGTRAVPVITTAGAVPASHPKVVDRASLQTAPVPVYTPPRPGAFAAPGTKPPIASKPPTAAQRVPTPPSERAQPARSVPSAPPSPLPAASAQHAPEPSRLALVRRSRPKPPLPARKPVPPPLPEPHASSDSDSKRDLPSMAPLSYSSSEVPVAPSVPKSWRRAVLLSVGVALAAVGTSVVCFVSASTHPTPSSGATVAVRAALEARTPRAQGSGDTVRTPAEPQTYRSLITINEVTVRAKAKHARHRAGIGKR